MSRTLYSKEKVQARKSLIDKFDRIINGEDEEQDKNSSIQDLKGFLGKFVDLKEEKDVKHVKVKVQKKEGNVLPKVVVELEKIDPPPVPEEASTEVHEELVNPQESEGLVNQKDCEELFNPKEAEELVNPQESDSEKQQRQPEPPLSPALPVLPIQPDFEPEQTPSPNQPVFEPKQSPRPNQPVFKPEDSPSSNQPVFEPEDSSSPNFQPVFEPEQSPSPNFQPVFESEQSLSPKPDLKIQLKVTSVIPPLNYSPQQSLSPEPLPRGIEDNLCTLIFEDMVRPKKATKNESRGSRSNLKRNKTEEDGSPTIQKKIRRKHRKHVVVKLFEKEEGKTFCPKRTYSAMIKFITTVKQQMKNIYEEENICNLQKQVKWKSLIERGNQLLHRVIRLPLQQDRRLEDKLQQIQIKFENELPGWEAKIEKYTNLLLEDRQRLKDSKKHFKRNLCCKFCNKPKEL